MRKSHYLSAFALVSAMTVAGAAQAQHAGETQAVRTTEAQADEATQQAEEAKDEAKAAQEAAKLRTGDAKTAHEASVDAQAAAVDAKQAAAKAQGAEAEAKGGSSATAAAMEAGQAATEATNAKLAAEAAKVSAQDAATPPPPPAEPMTMGDYDAAQSPRVLPAPPPGAKMLPQASASIGAPVWVTSSQGNPAPNAHGIDFPALDTNDDGWLSKSEATASGNADLIREYAVADTDRNGRLDRDEVNDW